MLRWLLVPALVVSVASASVSLALGGTERASSSDRESQQPNLSDMRACAYEAFSKRLGRCTRDQSAQVVYSSQIVCSAALADPQTTVRAEMGWRYGGKSIWKNSLVGRGRTVWTTFSLGGPFALPRGEYHCNLGVGSTTLVSVIRSSGPTGEVVDTAICDYRRSHMHFGNRTCIQDDEGNRSRLDRASYATRPS